jgi:signal peptidase|tara:strand:- start:413 stop:1090 length:678 start_codon:yes stop_codon:yes gene_type:complete
LTSNSTKNLVKDIIIIAVVIAVIWIGLQVIFGTANPFYVVSSGSMIPALQVYDVIVVEGNTPFQDIEKGDIIVFYAPAKYERGEERVIVHRTHLVMSENPKTIQTKGDANAGSLGGTDYPITEKVYLGKVEYVIPQVGYITKILQPPINYIIIAVIVGIMVVRHLSQRKSKPVFQNTKETIEKDQNISDEINDVQLDSEYLKKSDDLDSQDEDKSINSKTDMDEK